MNEQANASLLPLKAMHLPEAPSMLLLAWGWWAVIAVLIFTVLISVFLLRKSKRRLAPKKTALRLIKTCHNPAEAIKILRQTALYYYSRDEIAQLTGGDWYTFLDIEYGKPLFVPEHDNWQHALYSNIPASNADELVKHCYQWINGALPPKKKGVQIG